MSLSCQQLALMLTAKRRTRLNKLNNNTNNTGFNHSVNVKFVGRRYTTRPGAPAEVSVLASTPPGMPGTHPPNILVGGTSTGIPPQYYYVLSDIADQYWLPSVCSASSRFHSAIRRHQFASVRQADSRLTRLAPPPTLNSR